MRASLGLISSVSLVFIGLSVPSEAAGQKMAVHYVEAARLTCEAAAKAPASERAQLIRDANALADQARKLGTPAPSCNVSGGSDSGSRASTTAPSLGSSNHQPGAAGAPDTAAVRHAAAAERDQYIRQAVDVRLRAMLASEPQRSTLNAQAAYLDCMAVNLTPGAPTQKCSDPANFTDIGVALGNSELGDLVGGVAGIASHIMALRGAEAAARQRQAIEASNHAASAASALKEGKYSEAGSRFERAIAIDPSNPSYSRGQALAFLQAGDSPRAFRGAHQMMLINANDSDAQDLAKVVSSRIERSANPSDGFEAMGRAAFANHQVEPRSNVLVEMIGIVVGVGGIFLPLLTGPSEYDAASGDMVRVESEWRKQSAIGGAAGAGTVILLEQASLRVSPKSNHDTATRHLTATGRDAYMKGFEKAKAAAFGQKRKGALIRGTLYMAAMGAFGYWVAGPGLAM